MNDTSLLKIFDTFMNGIKDSLLSEIKGEIVSSKKSSTVVKPKKVVKYNAEAKPRKQDSRPHDKGCWVTAQLAQKNAHDRGVSGKALTAIYKMVYNDELAKKGLGKRYELTKEEIELARSSMDIDVVDAAEVMDEEVILEPVKKPVRDIKSSKPKTATKLTFILQNGVGDIPDQEVVDKAAKAGLKVSKSYVALCRYIKHHMAECVKASPVDQERTKQEEKKAKPAKQLKFNLERVKLGEKSNEDFRGTGKCSNAEFIRRCAKRGFKSPETITAYAASKNRKFTTTYVRGILGMDKRAYNKAS